MKHALLQNASTSCWLVHVYGEGVFNLSSGTSAQAYFKFRFSRNLRDHSAIDTIKLSEPKLASLLRTSNWYPNTDYHKSCTGSFLDRVYNVISWYSLRKPQHENLNQCQEAAITFRVLTKSFSFYWLWRGRGSTGSQMLHVMIVVNVLTRKRTFPLKIISFLLGYHMWLPFYSPSKLHAILNLRSTYLQQVTIATTLMLPTPVKCYSWN